MVLDPAYNTDLYREGLQKAYRFQEKCWPSIQQLYLEKNHARRRELYLSIAELEPDLYQINREIFIKRHEHATKSGSLSLLDHVTRNEKDQTDWRLFLRSRRFQTALQDYSRHYRQMRQNALAADDFNSWDFWIQSQNELEVDPHHLRLALTLDESIGLLKMLLMNLGYGDILSRVEWIKDERHTMARIGLDDDHNLKTSIAISESSCRASVGSLTYLSLLAHEIGHIIQAHTNAKPNQENLVPSHFLREVVSMFFQKLFLTENNLKRHETLDRFALDKVLSKIAFDDVESLMHFFCFLEFEISFYDLHSKGPGSPAEISRLWKWCRQKYFGFSEHPEEDHTWQINAFYLTYHPLYNRSYVIGDILSRLMLRKFLRSVQGNLDHPHASQTLQTIIKTCSDKGMGNTWKDFENACGSRKLGSQELMEEIIRTLKNPVFA